ncbi:MAG: TonB-dependent receptor [Acidobacteriia bacterium]|nr:TonB-dependent receptor [Terriglobia bacterium]
MKICQQWFNGFLVLLGFALLLLPVRVIAQEPGPTPASHSSPAPQPGPPATQAPSSSSSPAQAPSAASPSTAYGEISGTVKSGNIPLPGVTVSAANTLTGKRYITSTEVDGSFKISVGGKGRYVVKAEFSAFAPVTQEIVINEQNRAGKADLAMILLSRVQKEDQEQGQQVAQQMSAAGRQGMQQLALSGGGDLGGGFSSANTDAASLAGAGLPNAGLAAEGGNESVAVSGSMGRAEQNMFDPGEMQDRISDLREQLQQQGGGSGAINFGGGTANIQILGGGGFGGGGMGGGGPMVFIMGGGPGGGGGRGGRGGRGFNVNKPHGSIFFNYGGSLLDAKPYSLNGQPENKADYNQNRFGVTLGGPLNIPHIYHGGAKTFLFGSYTGSRSTNPYDVFSTVPTLAERSGNFQTFQVANINPAAAQILNFIPEPNLPGDVRNFHFVSASPSHSDTAFVRFNHSFGADQGLLGALGIRAQQRQQQRQQQSAGKKQEKTHWSQSISGGFVYNNIRNTVLNPFPGLGGNQAIHNYNFNVGHSAVKGLFINSLRFNYNRAGAQTLNHFTNSNNIEGQLGITGVSQLPADFGLPTLSFAPEFSSLQDLTPQFRTNQTFSVSDSMSLTHGKHSWTWGGDFRRQMLDTRNAANARGTFIFTGAATGQPFADFLAGFAQETSIQFGAEDYRFRSNSFDLFLQDNWRAGKNLTLNLGLRYEFILPFSELNGQQVNLDVASDFSAVAPVQPGQTGPITGKRFPQGLLRPDRNNFAPRVGIAWKPFPKTVVRAGYGINYNLGQYGQMATQLGFQPPFAVAQTNPAATPTSLTLQNGFPAPVISPNHITNSYAVDPDYRLAYVQSWNLNIQQEVKTSLVINIGYTGSKGTHLDIVRAPDQLATGGPRFVPCTPLTPAGTSCVAPFLFESSQGSSILHSGSLRVRKRMRHGFSLGGTYTYSKSIDNASSIGGGAAVVAQNDLDIAAERGLSSFDQRHRFSADYIYQLPFGKEQKWLHKDGWAQKAFSGIAVSGNVMLASGLPFSPRVFGSASDLGRGTTGATRPDLAPGQAIKLNNPSIGEWFNTAAFTSPTRVFGDAGRNIIIGPGTVSADMSLSKNIQVKEMQALEVRLTATNVFNIVRFTSIDSTFGSPTFGQVVGAGSMRKAQLSARYRF